MGKWIAGLAATVIGGVLVYWFTVGLNPTPAPQPQPPQPPPIPRVLKGYMVVNKTSVIRRAEDLRVGDKICTSKKGAELLRATPPISEFDLRILPATEIFPGLERGLCSAIFVLSREDADRLLPVDITSMRLMPVYDQ